ncbi:DNA primase, large subunit [Fistulina hepatica ATCC 64428]|nr:DNA primase, large subunit [Fistulina hepatica ATCC 64428]
MNSSKERQQSALKPTGAPVDFEVDNSGLFKFPYRLNFYDVPPLFDVSLEEFEACALDRLRILAEIESSATRNRSWEETKNVTLAQLRKYLHLDSNAAASGSGRARMIEEINKQRRKDHIGHFVLRLAFCRSEDLRRRFVKAESTLFKVRYDSDNLSEKAQFLASRDFHWMPVDKNEKALYEKELRAAYPANKTEGDQAFEKEAYYKVKWSRVPDLVEKRRVFLKKGWAYVPRSELSSIVFQEFDTHLQKDLEMTAKALPRLDEDTRILPILNNLSQGFLAGVSSEWAGATEGTVEGIRAEMIDDLAKKHFPLCMLNMHSQLRRDHKLYHHGRLTYGLFLKVLGLSIEEAIVFWRRSFDTITDDEFNKKYKYNVRHSYGLEGKRANYPAKSCTQILMGEPSSAHGCPYRHFSSENLQTTLLAMYGPQGLTSSDLPEIMHLTKPKSKEDGAPYHVACTRVFEITHGIPKGDGLGGGEHVTHPNQYAARSIELEKAAQSSNDDSNKMQVDQ